MLQRYDIAMNDQTDRLSIEEYAVLDTKSRKRISYPTVEGTYSLIYKVSFDGKDIRAAIKTGQKALISVLRTEDFYPIGSCAAIIADRVTGLLNGDPGLDSEVRFDDRSLIEGYEEG
ncbi:hypothetical protein D3OALGA1CA_1841 [Olavius algarvensis associated proteobacterium Delta 3]|nr:hypothetical protein D3OALGA1CA_1841 [Olavius algarvensis associated proteobacterium Delta 3]CAB5135773.1 hypothetical protein D3OALGB2SA_3921 [Olavius algarvensis associated proteobacterium Delta 3]